MKNSNNILKLVLLVVLALLTAVLIIYNIKIKDYAKPAIKIKQVTVDEKVKTTTKTKQKKVLKAPVTFIGVHIEEVDPTVKDPLAAAIFGDIYSGDVIDEDRIVEEFKLASGRTMYEYKSLLPHPDTTRFYITINNENTFLETARGVMVFTSYEEAKKEYENVLGIMSQYNDLVLKQGSDIYFKNDQKSLITVRLLTINENKFEVVVDGIFSDEL